MSYTEKIDVLDLLIKILREHEEKLDELVSRLEAEDLRRHGPRSEAEDVRRNGHPSEAELSRRFHEPL